LKKTTKLPYRISFFTRFRIGIGLILGLRIRDYRSAVRFMNHRFAGLPLSIRLVKLAIWGLKMSFIEIPNSSRWFSFPRNVSNTSHWLKDGNPYENYPWSQGEITVPQNVEVVVVGAGFGGSCVAYHWSKIGNGKLLLLDQSLPASGAAGRNAGFLTAAGGSYHGYYVYEPVRAYASKIRPELTDEQLDSIAKGFSDAYLKALTESVLGIHATIDSNAIECDLKNRGGFILSDKDDASRVQRALDLGAELGWKGWRRIEAKEVEKEIGIVGDNFAGLQEGTSTWNPARWVWGLIEVALRSDNVELYTDTKVLSVEPNANGYIVTTNRGTIFAKKVVNATEANTSEVFGKFLPGNDYELIRTHKSQAMYASDIVDGMAKGKAICLPLGWFHGKESGFLFGSDNHRVPASHANKNDPSRFVSMYMSATTTQTWAPQKFRVIREWTGCVGQAPDKFPVVGALSDPGVFMLGGFAGAGSAISYGAALEIVEQITGKIRQESLWNQDLFGVNRFLKTDTYGQSFV
jgi:glycine/D-amino acid oxidase-like deaminating enzyme